MSVRVTFLANVMPRVALYCGYVALILAIPGCSAMFNPLAHEGN